MLLVSLHPKLLMPTTKKLPVVVAVYDVFVAKGIEDGLYHWKVTPDGGAAMVMVVEIGGVQ
jgi:hypothetical protein